MHCDFYIYYFFPRWSIRTRVISGFGGMQLKIEMNLFYNLDRRITIYDHFIYT